jgi:hypothetical protein
MPHEDDEIHEAHDLIEYLADDVPDINPFIRIQIFSDCSSRSMIYPICGSHLSKWGGRGTVGVGLAPS